MPVVSVQLIVALSSFICAMWLTHFFSRPGTWFYVLDHPNERSMHEFPTPRAGGLAIFITLTIALLILSAFSYLNLNSIAWLALSSVIVAVISYIDDHSHIPFIIRLLVQTIAALLLIYSGLSISDIQIPGLLIELPVYISYLITGLFIVWMTNLYNFMDGMDGFAGGMTVIGFGSFALVGWFSGNTEFMLINLVTAASAAGFLVFNFPPAKIFMGDVGSSFLGFMAAGCAIWASKLEILPLWFSILIFSPFIVDATVTLLRRLVTGERIWEAHKTHYYQKLAQSGWGHKRTVLWEYCLMLCCAASAIFAIGQPSMVHWSIIMFWIVAYILLMIAVSLQFKRHKSQ